MLEGADTAHASLQVHASVESVDGSADAAPAASTPPVVGTSEGQEDGRPVQHDAERCTVVQPSGWTTTTSTDGRYLMQRALKLGGELVITYCGSKTPAARENVHAPGTTVFYTRDEQSLRITLCKVHSTVEEEALAHLQAGETGRLFRPLLGAGFFTTLVVRHVAVMEDISPLRNGSLWKLALCSSAPHGQRPVPGALVGVKIDTEPMDFAWGLGQVPNTVEFATCHMAQGERAEIRRSRDDGPPSCVVEVFHVGPSDEYAIAEEDPWGKRLGALARRLFMRDNVILAWWHWSSMFDAIASAAEGPLDGESLTLRVHLADVLGHLSLCLKRLGHTGLAKARAMQCVDLLGADSKPTDLLRLAKAASASEDDILLARATCQRALAMPRITAIERVAFLRLHKQIRRQARALALTKSAMPIETSLETVEEEGRRAEEE